MSSAQHLNRAFQVYEFSLDAVRLTERQRHLDVLSEELTWRVTRRMQHDPSLGR